LLSQLYRYSTDAVAHNDFLNHRLFQRMIVILILFHRISSIYPSALDSTSKSDC
jgi:hypothetical protein